MLEVGVVDNIVGVLDDVVDVCVDFVAGYEADSVKKQGGTNTAPQPVFLLLASLCGCELATARFVALKSSPKIKMGRIEFDLNAKRDERGAISLPLGSSLPVPSRLQHVWGTATVHDTNATHEQITRLGDEVHLRCPVANMIVLSGCVLDIHWKIAEVEQYKSTVF